MMRNVVVERHVNFLSVQLLSVATFDIKHSVRMVGSTVAHMVQMVDLLSVHHVLVVQVCNFQVSRHYVGRDRVSSHHHARVHARHHTRHHGRVHGRAHTKTTHAVLQGVVEVGWHVAADLALEGLESLLDALNGLITGLFFITLCLAQFEIERVLFVEVLSLRKYFRIFIVDIIIAG